MFNALLSLYLSKIARRLRLSDARIDSLEHPIKEYILAIVRRRGFATREDLYYVRMQHKSMGDTMALLKRLMGSQGQ